MEQSRCHTNRRNWGSGSSCKAKSLNFLYLLDSPVPLPFPDHRQHMGKNVSLIAFRQILLKFLTAAYIFSNTIMKNLKKLIGNKSPNAKQSGVGLSPRIIPLTFMGNLGDRGKYQPTAKNLPISPCRKIFLDIFLSPPIKSVIPSSTSNSKFHIITLYYTSFICGYSHSCCISFLKFSLYMYTHATLI